MKNSKIDASEQEQESRFGKLTSFATLGRRSVKTNTMKQAGFIFAERAARSEFGRRGDCRTCNISSYAEDGSFAEFTAFIGLTVGNETTGRNINFTVNSI